MKLWGCAICEREFYTKREKEKHKNQYHLGDNDTDRVVKSTVKSAKKKKVTSDTNCVTCAKNFLLPSELERHTESMHGDGHREEEEKVVNGLDLLKETEMGQGCYLCVSCGMEFSSLGEQEQHMAMHRGVWVGEAMASHTMEREGMTPSTESLLRENTELKRELQESNWTISKLKTMLKQSRLKVRELEAERSKREIYDDFEKEIETLETSIPSKVVVKQEIVEQNGSNSEKVSDMVSQMDLFLKQINQTQVLNKTQSEELLSEGNISEVTLTEKNTTSTETFEINEPQKRKITNEISHENISSRDFKIVQKENVSLVQALQNEGLQFDCQVCEKVFINKLRLKRHQIKHTQLCIKPVLKPKSKEKQEKCKSSTSNLRIVKSKPKIATCDIEDKIKKRSDGKYECNECNHKHVSQKQVTYHIMSQHKGHTWDCNVCGTKYGSPYQLNIHHKDKHISADKESLCLNNDKIEPSQIKKTHAKIKTKSHSSSIKTAEGKFQCPYCIVESKYKSYIKIHIKNKHEEQKFKDLEIENKLHDVLKKYLE